MASQSAQTPLHGWHLAHNAKLGDFAGWDMPLQYPSGVLAEHRAVRSSCGVFDVSHMGTFQITGSEAMESANTIFTNDLSALAIGQIQYTLLCNDQGGVIDDLLITRVSGKELIVVPNAGNTAAVLAVLRSVLPEESLNDIGAETAIIAVQGPQAPEVLRKSGFDPELGYMRAHRSGESIVARSGYTGEVGYELLVPADEALPIWNLLIAAGASPCGLAARDTLRTEMGYPLHGQDITPDISPVMAGLGWAVAWDKAVFHGRQALIQQRSAGPDRRLRGVRLTQKGVPRPGMAIEVAGAEVGVTTSGTFSPTLETGIALALVDATVELGAQVQVQARGRGLTAQIVAPPFVSASPR